ncbi:hypothetical protein B0H13DRAFT_2549654 [Mycena leptocephala]|nr:hypothetical protein B0H13DRAFT_2549654 [Mycena leptocephala]
MYTHYSTLSTVQANWGLKSLGRQDTNATVSNVLAFVAAKTGYQNVDVPASEMPEFNLTGVVSGALSASFFFVFSPSSHFFLSLRPLHPLRRPNLKAKGASGVPVLLRPGLNTKLTPPPVNRTALDRTTPWQIGARTTSGGSIVECGDAREAGLLADHIHAFSPSVLVDPAESDCARRAALKLFGIDQKMPLYVLYIFAPSNISSLANTTPEPARNDSVQLLRASGASRCI